MKLDFGQVRIFFSSVSWWEIINFQTRNGAYLMKKSFGLWMFIASSIAIAPNIVSESYEKILVHSGDHSRFKFRAMRIRGGRSNSPEKDVFDGDEAYYQEVLRIAEEMRLRVPSDEEVKRSEGFPVALDNKAAEAELRSSLDSFNVNAFGIVKDNAEETEDELGPLILLKSFWESEIQPHSQPRALSANDNLLKDPLKAFRGADWNAVASQANAAALEAASRWPAKCGADRVRALPSVRGLPGGASGALEAAASGWFRTDRFRALLTRLLELVVDGGVAGAVHPGQLQVAAFLYLLLPMTTTARIFAVLQGSDRYLLGYWSDPDADEAPGARPAGAAKPESDAAGWAGLVEAGAPEAARKMRAGGVSVEAVGREWFGCLMFDILGFAARSPRPAPRSPPPSSSFCVSLPPALHTTLSGPSITRTNGAPAPAQPGMLLMFYTRAHGLERARAHARGDAHTHALARAHAAGCGCWTSSSSAAPSSCTAGASPPSATTPPA